MKQHKNRYKIVVAIFLLVAFIFITKLFYIQVINDNYKFSANNNVLRYDVQQAVRGLIYDRDSNLIVSNVPAYDLMIIPRELKGKTIDTLAFCNLTAISKEDFITKYKKAAEYSGYKESVFIKHISLKSSSTLSEKLFQFPGFYLRKLTMRNYPSNVATHLVGYLGEVNLRKTKEDPYYTKGDLTGVSGVEAAYEKQLRGTKGMAIKLVDVHNRDQGNFQEGRFDTLPISGSTLTSTIDIELQEYGEQLMENKIGAIVAIEPSSGEILSLVSAPTYNPNLLIGRKRSENYSILSQDENKPLFNRALQGTYPPGSTFKLINGLIALQEGAIRKSTSFTCNGDDGYYFGKDKHVGCHPHQNPLDLLKGIEISCNAYFCNTYEKYFSRFNSTIEAYNNWYSHVSSFGIGNFMNNDFITGSPGKLPKSTYFNTLYKGSWNANTIISMSIGQGELLLTPIQMANMTAILANRGFYYTPHIIKNISGENAIDSNFTIKKYCSIDEKYFTPIIDGMHNVVEGKKGTAQNCKIPNYEICGKTGTAQNPHGEDHSIFIAFAPKENPKIAIAVYVENGGWGSTWAAPIASLMIEKYLKRSITNKAQEAFILNGNLINKE
ncbi:penicillin-binding protein 2 [Flavobacteriales bacterium]|jgi:penicillin-binding protein 2|nr:penicillin-binding protein 2 [Flavobacteriales bacterium]MBT4882308.1 penicillin-binding protein 2 [Flavobacteriales bacterium]MDC3305364.1 penicillin-binding protein 2 [Flavobacteriales bacterium]MDC3395252.1 penicillin-binding protein 2 [Flavobacteriales bacterium]MDG1348495.1 penicillin-binding protein 2 [Flavobacteriales bacterium]|tara:strand:- start:3389 stop:5215 length:1827 start_codon:yes stop_codon:yes gene_type:complete